MDGSIKNRRDYIKGGGKGRKFHSFSNVLDGDINAGNVQKMRRLTADRKGSFASPLPIDQSPGFMIGS